MNRPEKQFAASSVESHDPRHAGRRLERLISRLFLLAAVGLAVDAVGFLHYSPSTFVGNLVRLFRASYVSYYFAIFSSLAALLSLITYPFDGGSVFRTNVKPWAEGLDDHSLRSTCPGGRAVVVLGLLGLACAFLAVRWVLLPSIYGPDQGLYQNAAMTLFSGLRCPLPSLVGSETCNLEHPPLAKILIAISLEAWGNTPTASRLPSLVLGTLTVPLSASIMWSLTRNKAATVLAVVLLALDPMFFSWTTLSNLDTVEVFFTTAGIAVYVSKPTSPARNMVAGSLMGLAILSKEVAAFALLGLIGYHLVSSKTGARLGGALLLFGFSAGVFALGLQAYDSVFTEFPTFLAHAAFIITYGFSQPFSWSNPMYWLVSVAAEDWRTYYILNIFASALALIWLPVGLWKAVGGRCAEAKTLVLASFWLFWTYVPYEALYLIGRVEYYYYAFQMVPPLTLGGAYILASGRLPAPVRALILGGSVAWFILFFPTDQVFLPSFFKPF